MLGIQNYWEGDDILGINVKFSFIMTKSASVSEIKPAITTDPKAHGKRVGC
jgi:hypothetical protein